MRIILFSLIFLIIIGSAQAADIIVDNDDGSPGYTETGTWITSSSAGYNGGTYRYVYGVSGSPTASATWTPDLPEARLYHVYAAYRQSTNRTTSAPLTITHSEGTTLVYLDQSGDNEIVETFIGEFLFDAGTSGSVRMDNNTTDILIADTMIWRIPVDPPPTVSDISRNPEIVSQTDTVTVTATITDNVEVSSVTFSYYLVPSGTPQTSQAYDDGTHGDGAAGDTIYGATVPPQSDGSIVACYFTATDNFGQPADSMTCYYPVGPLPAYLPDVVVDNDDGSPGYIETGTWTTSASTGYDGGTYRYATASTGLPTSTATWTPDLPRSGVYKVYAAFARGENRTASAPITINHSEGQSVVNLNQYGSSAIVEILIGEFPFDSGTGSSVQMDNSGTAGAYIADTIIWHQPSDLPPVISMITRDPITPGQSDSVLVTASITDNIGISSAALSYTVNSGSPIEVPAYDDGAHGDGAAGDNIYGATIPAQPDGTTIRFTYSAVDSLGQSSTGQSQAYVVGQEPHNVYIVLSSDTSVWGVSGGYYGTASWEVFESQTGVLSQIYDESFRLAHVDSLGNPFKITWFMHGGAWFTTAVNSTPISATYHIRKNWGSDIELWDDALEYHFHHYAWDGSAWVMATTFEETIWEYETVMSQMMLDENLFITSFRSGWNYMDNGYQQYLERWVPFRMEGVQSGWVPYHPSFDNYRLPGTMKGWEVRHYYTKSFSSSVANQVLSAANSGTDQVVCIWSHQNEADFPQQLSDVDYNLHQAQLAHPGVQFHYCNAKEAMQRWIGETSAPTPLLEVHPVICGDNVDVTILTEDYIYQEQPWIAARPYSGLCVRLDSVNTSPGIWEFSYSREEYDHVAVGVSDIYGNEIITEVDDCSKRWAVQSEFAKAQPYQVDFESTPTVAMLQKDEGVYAAGGTLTFDHNNIPEGEWLSIIVDATIPAGTSVQVRYKTADTEELLDSAVWSAYYNDQVITLPQDLQQPWIRIEALLEGTSTETPELNSIEVTYDNPFTVSGYENWWKER